MSAHKETEHTGGTPGITEDPAGVVIRVYVTPRASTNSVVGVHGDEVKVSLTTPPVDGAANKALIEFLARRLGVPKSAVSLASGEASRHKVVVVEGIETKVVLDKLLGK